MPRSLCMYILVRRLPFLLWDRVLYVLIVNIRRYTGCLVIGQHEAVLRITRYISACISSSCTTFFVDTGKTTCTPAPFIDFAMQGEVLPIENLRGN